MHFHLLNYVLAILLIFSFTGCSRSTPTPNAATDYPQVTIPGSEIRQLHSTETGRDYDLYIRLPEDYDQYPKVKYPVLYLLDAQWDFKLLDSIYGSLHYDGDVPQMVIVGITYSGNEPDYETLRAMDYTPVHQADLIGSGDAPKFLAFMKDRLIPFIEENYHVRPLERYLMGSSFGGTFTLYTLFSEPDLFAGFVAASPATPYGDDFAFEQEETYYQAHKDLPVRLFICVGEKEALLLPVQRYIDQLESHVYTDLQQQTRIIADEGHSSSKIEGYTRGLQFLFQQ
jgi:predicted alpha/beta superfamily hydrolase